MSGYTQVTASADLIARAAGPMLSAQWPFPISFATVLLALSTVALVLLFLARHRLFPKLYAVHAGSLFAVLCGGLVLMPDGAILSLSELEGAAVVMFNCICVVPYLFLSQRVTEAFGSSSDEIPIGF